MLEAGDAHRDLVRRVAHAARDLERRDPVGGLHHAQDALEQDLPADKCLEPLGRPAQTLADGLIEHVVENARLIPEALGDCVLHIFVSRDQIHVLGDLEHREAGPDHLVDLWSLKRYLTPILETDLGKDVHADVVKLHAGDRLARQLSGSVGTARIAAPVKDEVKCEEH